MIINIPEADDIYFAKTREYFREVLSSYASDNYRSAVVMLYSVAICDMLFKLQELRDMYNDTKASEILAEVEKSRNTNDNKSKSKWEKEFVDNVFKNTKLLDLEAYTNLNHLYDYRNFSAHPALNENYELVSPTKETVISCICNTVKDILVKPPIFVKSVIDMLTDDLDGKIELYHNEKDTLEIYLNNKYYSKMNITMKLSVFRALWKFCFISEDDKCAQNRAINRLALEVLSHGIETDIEEDIHKNQNRYTVAYDKTCVLYLIGFLAIDPFAYKNLNQDTKLRIDKQIEQTKDVELLTWFKYTNFDLFYDAFKQHSYIEISKQTVSFAFRYMEKYGYANQFLNLLINNYGRSPSFDAANTAYKYSIRPYLRDMTREQFVALIEVSNSNDQIYNRWLADEKNTEIVTAGKDLLGNDFDYSKYPNFKFDEKVLSTPEEEDDLPDFEQEIF